MSEDYDKSPAFHLYQNRIVYLCGDITTATAEHVVSCLLVLDSIDHESEIKLYISSFGGSVYAGFAIYDAMMMVRAPVSTVAFGPAFSMGAWLLAAGESGRRFVTPNARVMLHQSSAGFTGTTGDIKVAAENVLKNEQHLNMLLARHTGRPMEEIAQCIQRDLWLDPEEAIAFGVADAIVPANDRKMKALSQRAQPAPEARASSVQLRPVQATPHKPPGRVPFPPRIP